MRPGEWSPVGIDSLEPNAFTAATQVARNQVVSAGPGAGKTEMLAQRADFLLRTGSAPFPRRILAISFKVDAAGNLRDRVRRRSGDQYAARLDSFTFHGFAKRLIDNYYPALTGINALSRDYVIDPDTRIQGTQITFNDLVPRAIDILESNRYALGALQMTYSHVFLDEFQDATKEQYTLLKAAFLATNAQLTAVGDDKQSIMGWAGALSGIMATFAKDFDADAVPLYQNFRSKPRLRRLQNRMVRQMDVTAAAPDDELLGEDGIVQVVECQTDIEEATAIADLIEGWLSSGTAPHEIAVLIRNQPDLIGQTLFAELDRRGVSYRNEQQTQDLISEPVAALLYNFLRVISGDRDPDAYSELSRVALRELDGDRWELQGSRLSAVLHRMRLEVRSSNFDRADSKAWRPLVTEFLKFVGRPTLTGLAPSYQQGDRLDEVAKQAFKSFRLQLEVDGDPVAALHRLSALHAVRILTIHKCKGLEFEKVVVLGVEHQLFWGDEYMQGFFVAVSRAKDELVLTHVSTRAKPVGAISWKTNRTPHGELLGFVAD